MSHHFTNHPHRQPSPSLSPYSCLALSYLSLWCYSVCSCYSLCFTPCCFHCCATRSLCCYSSLQSNSSQFFFRLLLFASTPPPPSTPTHPCYLRFHPFESNSGLVLQSLLPGYRHRLQLLSHQPSQPVALALFCYRPH